MNQQQSSSQPRGNSLKWLLIILAVVVVFGGSYLLYAKYGKSTNTATTTTSPTATTSTPTPTTTPTSTTEKTADWKTYNNDSYGISFKYPKDWIIQNDQLESALIYLGLNTAGYTPKPDTDQPNSANFYLYESISKLDSKKLSPSSLKDYLDKYSALSDPTYKNVTTQKIGSLNGYSADAGPNQFGGGKYYFVELSNKQIVEFWLFDTRADSETMNTILSTFQFTK